MMKSKAISRKYFLIFVPTVSILIVLMYYFALDYDKSVLYYVPHSLLMTLGLWMGCVAIVTLLWRKFPWEHHPVKHIIYEVLAIILYTNSFSILLFYLEIFLGYSTDNFFENPRFWFDIFTVNIITLFITAIHEMVFFYKQWRLNFSKSTMLEKDKIQAKYEALKAQINPHFLFNSLNSLVSIVDDNQKAVDYIENLSDFLRYSLKIRNQELVSVKEELEIVENYKHLMQSRFGSGLNIIVEVPESLHSWLLPPMALQMLLENAIKHNIVSSAKPLNVLIKAKESTLIISNNLQIKKSAHSTGQGLENLKERLAFFTARTMKTEQSDTEFNVELPLVNK